MTAVAAAVPSCPTTGRVLRAGAVRIALDAPLVMGIVNVTPDSFSDGGRYAAVDLAVEQARRLIAEGAGIIDIGGESTRPGAPAVPPEVERERVLPVLRRLVRETSVPLSVDTSEPGLMIEAVDAGACLINDVRGLRRPGALAAAARSGAAVCVMHMQGEPSTMQVDPRYEDVVHEISGYLASRIADCMALGMAPDRLVIDPGFGFGKTLEHHLAMMARLEVFSRLGCPLLVGLSRKSMLGLLTGRPVSERLYAGVAAAAIAVSRGADIVRAHDVAPTVDAIRIGAAMRRALERSAEQ